MRLLHSKTLKLEEFNGKRVPPYAILSHTWGEDEISFQDSQCRDADKKAGYEKIKHCCEIAAADGFEYAWVDSCCIDKTSSSELSEAINSMYRWYKEAQVCYAYLSDVPSCENPWTEASAFSKSRWFTRGWTLQELIAPTNLIFFGSDWKEVGTRSSLLGVISETTNIQIEALHGNDYSLETFSIAQRMSWASRRETTRLEDLAYCLLGIFNINMPMLYGEGENAFIRLQEEIMKNTDDPTIFTWRTEPRRVRGKGGYISTYHPDSGNCKGLFARSPTYFRDSGHLIRSNDRTGMSFTMTNKGLHLQLRLKDSMSKLGVLKGVLDCHEVGKSDQLIGILLAVTSDGKEYYQRYHSHRFETIATSEVKTFEMKSVYAWVSRDRGSWFNKSFYNKCFLRTTGLQDNGILISDAYPSSLSPLDGHTIFGGDCECTCAIKFTADNKESWVIVLRWLSQDWRFSKSVHANIVTPFEDENLRDIVQSFETKTAKRHERAWKTEPDRILWQLPLRKDCISVAIRKQIIFGAMAFMVDIKRVDFEPSN